MPSNKPLERLSDVRENCERILRHVAGMTREGYRRDEKTIDAVERCLQRISEAAARLGSALDEAQPDVPWKQARGIGNILRHKYDEVTDDLIWHAIEHDIPRLSDGAKREIERLKRKGASASA